MADTQLTYKNLKITSSIKNYEVIFCPWEEFIFDQNDIFIIDSFLKTKFNFLNERAIFVDAGEQQKTIENIPNIILLLKDKNINRNSRIVAIGGGTIQDIAGFISTILFRGVDWLFVPTTLIAQGDSCIGGKTSINLAGKKNQIGTYNPPNLVINDVSFLRTLPEKEFFSGLGEMLHYFLVDSMESFRYYKENLTQIENLIYKALSIKKNTIEKDEFDKKERLLFNYGHSFGHAIESATNYQIPHGIAVSIGMDLANYISVKEGLLSDSENKEMQLVINDISSLFANYEIKSNKVIKALRQDKKNKNNKYGLILSKGVGQKFLTYYSFNSRIEKYINKYLINYSKKI